MVVYRRPLRDDQWYSKTEKEWGELGPSAQKSYHHIGRIEETEYGYKDTLRPCNRCRGANHECKRYTDEARQKLGVGEGCARCRQFHQGCHTGPEHDEGADVDDEPVAPERKLKRASFVNSASTVNTQSDRSEYAKAIDVQPASHKENNDPSERSAKRPRRGIFTPFEGSRQSTASASFKRHPGDRSHIAQLRATVVANLPMAEETGEAESVRLLTTTTWAQHQFAMMARMEALEKEVQDLKEQLARRAFGFQVL